MSKVVKGVGKVVKGAVKGSKKIGKGILKGVKKVFKPIWSSTIGKVALTAAAIYLGGWALGAWSGPGGLAAGAQTSMVPNALGAAAPATGSIATTPLPLGGGTFAGAAGGAAAGAAAPTASLTTLPAAGAAGSTAAQGAGGGLIASAAPQISPAVQVLPEAAGVAGSSTAGGIYDTIKNLAGGASNWVKNNQLVSAVGIAGLGNALAQTPAEQQIDYEEDIRKRRERYLGDVGSVDIGVSPTGKPLTDMYGQPVYPPSPPPIRGPGIINGRRS